MGDDLHPVTQVVAVLTGLAAAAWAGWCTVIAFIGGRLPIPFVSWHVEGGIGWGLAWIMFIDPLILTVAYWGAMLVMSPFFVAEAVRDSRRSRRDDP